MKEVWYVTRGMRMHTQGVITPSIDPFNMSLLKYIQTNAKPDGPLSTIVPFLSVVAAKKR